MYRNEKNIPLSKIKLKLYVVKKKLIKNIIFKKKKTVL